MKYVLCLHKYGVPLDDPCSFPLGFMYVSSILKSQGHDVKVLNYNLQDYDFKKEIEGADTVLFTGFEEFSGRNKEFSKIANSLGIKTVLGGAMATHETVSQYPYFDGVVYGEYEYAVGIDPRHSPYPDYEGFGIDEYHKRNSVKHVGVLTSRGCPHKCTFCSSTCEFSIRSIYDVEEEIDHYIEKYHPDIIVFNDNTLNFTDIRFKRICKMMKGKGVAWSAAIRTDNFDEECAVMAKESGCRYFVVGVESFSQNKLNEMGKRLQVSQTIQTLDLLEKYGIGYHGNVIFGIGSDTYESVKEEIKNTPWQKYKIFPVVYRPFVGCTAKSSVFSSSKIVRDMFSKYIISKGKYMYPEGLT